ncbi:MAG: hypothetical protein BWY88_00958 [Synergistetes bacterium ADurb.Bin520]|nr:MAG: hypothetical protein BWY88_00958 [Synergistetes bacterium ADurb.Bin520]
MGQLPHLVATLVIDGNGEISLADGPTALHDESQGLGDASHDAQRHQGPEQGRNHHAVGEDPGSQGQGLRGPMHHALTLGEALKRKGIGHRQHALGGSLQRLGQGRQLGIALHHHLGGGDVICGGLAHRLHPLLVLGPDADHDEFVHVIVHRGKPPQGLLYDGGVARQLGLEGGHVSLFPRGEDAGHYFDLGEAIFDEGRVFSVGDFLVQFLVFQG